MNITIIVLTLEDEMQTAVAAKDVQATDSVVFADGSKAHVIAVERSTVRGDMTTLALERVCLQRQQQRGYSKRWMSAKTFLRTVQTVTRGCAA